MNSIRLKNSLWITIPDSLYNQLQDLAEQENIPFEQLVNMALSAQIVAWHRKNDLETRANLGNWQDFQEILALVEDREAEAHDRLSSKKLNEFYNLN